MPRLTWPRAIGALILAGIGWYLWAALSPGPPIVVIDGDTVARGRIRHRLLGLDTPEIKRAKCKQETARGMAAKARLEQLLANYASVSLKPSGKPDRYGRMLSRLTIDGVDVVDIAVKEGWGIRYDGRVKPDWCFIDAPLVIPPAPLPPVPPPHPTEGATWRPMPEPFRP